MRDVPTSLLPRVSSLAGAVRIFPSEQAVIDYVRSTDYDSPPAPPDSVGADSDSDSDSDSSRDGEGASGHSRQGRNGARSSRQAKAGKELGGAVRDGESEGEKVGMAVIFNKAPLEGETAAWDYTLRLNYTYGVSMFEEQVRGD